MAQLLERLLGLVKVAVISGGAWEQFEQQVLAHLPHDECLQSLSLLPTCGTRFYRYGSGWELLYAEDFTEVERKKIIDSLQQTITSTGGNPERVWGELIEDRGSQVTYSALGQAAPLDAKAAWDPDGTKKRLLVARTAPLLPGFEVRGGGSTSIDVTRQGIDKAYAIRKLMAQLHAAPQELLFVGDRLDEAGNDYPVLAAGVPCVAVTSWQDTLTVIAQFIEWWDGVTSSPRFRIISRDPGAAR